jgi:hypothetical protein
MKYLLIVILLTTAGELQMDSGPVAECPPQEEMAAKIKSMKEAGIIKDWGAYCIATKLPMDKDGNPIEQQGI